MGIEQGSRGKVGRRRLALEHRRRHGTAGHGDLAVVLGGPIAPGRRFVHLAVLAGEIGLGRFLLGPAHPQHGLEPEAAPAHDA